MRDNRRDMTMINERIRYGSVRVVDDQNQQVGIMETRDALQLARSKELDLILVAEKAQPPVCRIMNYGKFKYEQSKKKKSTSTAATEMKMVRLHPRTGVHDRQILERHAEKFLRHGHKVRVVCQFRGRENAHPEIGRAQLDAISGSLAEISSVEGTIMKQGRDMIMYLVPKPGLKPLPKVAKESWKAKPAQAGQAPAEELVDEIEDDELPDEYSAPGVVDEDDDEEGVEGEGDGTEDGDDDASDDDAPDDDAHDDDAHEDAPDETQQETIAESTLESTPGVSEAVSDDENAAKENLDG